MEDIIILGSGPAGLTAGVYAARGNAKTMIIHGPQPGGQLMYTQHIDNYPGVVTSGPGLIDNMKKQCAELNVTFVQDYAVSVSKNMDSFQVNTSTNSYQAKSVIVATGSSSKWLEVPGAEQFKGNGISTCATCDGFAFRNKTVAVVGGGNTAVEDAIYLAKMAKKVYLIHRRDQLRAEKIMQDALFKLDTVEFVWNTTVSEVLSQNNLITGVKIDTKGSEDTIDLDGIFVAIGHTPNTQFLQNFIELDEYGYVITTNTTDTTYPGFYIAGDVSVISSDLGKQAIVAAGTGCTAAMKALKFISH